MINLIGMIQVQIVAGWEGWLAPAQRPIHSTLKVGQIERGQATLPNLHLSPLELFQFGVRDGCSLPWTYT